MPDISPDKDVATGGVTTITDEVLFATVVRLHNEDGYGWTDQPSFYAADPSQLYLAVGGDVGRVKVFGSSSLHYLGGTSTGTVHLLGQTASIRVAGPEVEWTLDGNAMTDTVEYTFSESELNTKHTMIGEWTDGVPLTINFVPFTTGCYVRLDVPV